MVSRSKKRKRQRAAAASAQSDAAAPPRDAFRMPRAPLIAAAVVLVSALSALAWFGLTRDLPEIAPAHFAGSRACQSCHADAYSAWRGSQHQRAMQHASEANVLGDFNDATFRYAGTESRFFKRDGRFFVRTEGTDGALADFEIKYTYGVYPLQQYLIEFPDGRVQALSITWDSRPAAEGGQRWFHQYPNEAIDHDDELHWTQRAQNWNFMCADCHSTDVRKNYDIGTDSFDTEWAEITVGCEACHGPGSKHIAWAQSESDVVAKGLVVALDERRGVSWRIDPDTGIAARSQAKATDNEIEVCAQCHARRAQIAEGYQAGEPFLDHYLPSLLLPPLYYVDGQQRGEVYIWGSYLQSKMHAKGVTCSDCHEPHTQKLRAEGNAVCAQCHLPEKYAAPSHHFHNSGQPGSQCVDCHMPAATYMVIDPRRDHSLRVPRPDLTMSIGTPNACNGCHHNRSAQWANAAIEKWHGSRAQGYQQFATAFAAAQRGAAGAAPALAALLNDAAQPPIVRASAAQLLQDFPSREMMDALNRGLADPDPLVRLGSLQGAESLPLEQRATLVAPLLADRLRAVRIEAVRILAPLPDTALSGAQRAAFAAAAEEFMATQRYNADRPEARTALGSFLADRGRQDEAERWLQSAIDLEPRHVPAYVNLADLRRAQGRDGDAEALLRRGLEANPGAAALHHALGLTLVRLGETPESLQHLRRATQLAPGDTRFAYVYAVALNSRGRTSDALREIDRALRVRSDERELLIAGALFSRDAGDRARAAAYARRLALRYPTDPQALQLLRELAPQR